MLPIFGGGRKDLGETGADRTEPGVDHRPERRALVRDIVKYIIAADPTQVEDPKEAAEKLSPILNIPGMTCTGS